MSKGIVIRILPHHAEQFREQWTEMKHLDISEDAGPSLHEAIYAELQNLQLRWGDAIEYAKEQIEKGE